jgi:hypothetical protein
MVNRHYSDDWIVTFPIGELMAALESTVRIARPEPLVAVRLISCTSIHAILTPNAEAITTIVFLAARSCCKRRFGAKRF